VRSRSGHHLWAIALGLAAVVAATGVAIALLSGGDSDAASPTDPIALEPVGKFEAPTHITAPPGDDRRLAVVERGGRVWMLVDGKRGRLPFVDLRSRVSSVSESGERGLLSVAFAPDYARTGLLYAAYTDRTGDLVVDELRVDRDGDRARRARTLLRVPHRTFDNHNGGQLQFGPDGMLYIGTGDGGGAWDPFRAGQDKGSLAAKVLRIDPRPGPSGDPYRIPPDNPFADGRGGARPEVAILGTRNPWRFSFDRDRGDLVIADVGQDEREELTFLENGGWLGANLGWSCFEGTKRLHDCPAPGHIEPSLERQHKDGECSITGGFVVRDPDLRPLNGRYVYGDFCTGRVRSVILGPDGARDDRPAAVNVPLLASFGEDAKGRIYAASLEGQVYRLRDGAQQR
jgi:glucose/arabinose dehydrogenase